MNLPINVEDATKHAAMASQCNALDLNSVMQHEHGGCTCKWGQRHQAPRAVGGDPAAQDEDDDPLAPQRPTGSATSPVGPGAAASGDTWQAPTGVSLAGSQHSGVGRRPGDHQSSVRCGHHAACQVFVWTPRRTIVVFINGLHDTVDGVKAQVHAK